MAASVSETLRRVVGKRKTAGKSTPIRKTNAKKINLALQGGGAHGAFTWGVLDRILEDGRIDIEGISGTSAGAMNAVVLVDGWVRGGRDGAREQLHKFWRGVSRKGGVSGPPQTVFDAPRMSPAAVVAVNPPQSTENCVPILGVPVAERTGAGELEVFPKPRTIMWFGSSVPVSAAELLLA